MLNEGATMLNAGATMLNDGSAMLNACATILNDGSTMVNAGATMFSDGWVRLYDILQVRLYYIFPFPIQNEILNDKRITFILDPSVKHSKQKKVILDQVCQIYFCERWR